MAGAEKLTAISLVRCAGGRLSTSLLGASVALGALGCRIASAEERSALEVAPAQLRVNAERATLPLGEKLGLVGTTYLLDLPSGLSIGPGVYSAVQGRRGGFFTIGGEIAWRFARRGPLSLEAGLYVGGGGGGAAAVGSGLVLRPHVDLLWNFSSVSAGLSASRLLFPDGGIDSHQLGLVVTARTDFRYVPSERLGLNVDSPGRSGVGFDRLLGVLTVYRPQAGARRVSGSALSSAIGLVGVRAERFLEPNRLGFRTYWGLEAAGAGSGGAAGYAEYLADAGAEFANGQSSRWGVRVGVGAGGGGDVDTGGGLLAKAGVYGRLRLTPTLHLQIEAGRATAPQGSLRARYAAASVVWVADDTAAPERLRKATRTEWSTGVESYVARRVNGPPRALQAASLKGNLFLGDELYATGQANSAFAGGAGAYMVGLVGLGVQVPLGSRLHGGFEALVGAGGGGGVSTQGGAIAQAKAYAGVALGRSLSLRAGVGRLKSLRGTSTEGLDSVVWDVSLVFTFGLPVHASR